MTIEGMTRLGPKPPVANDRFRRAEYGRHDI